MQYLPYGRQDISDADIAAVVEALKRPLITQGPLVEEFEKALAAAVGAKYAVAVNSGTAALHAAYAAAGVGPGDAVVTTPITFAATANAALYLGARPVFADVDPETAQLDVTSVLEHAPANTKVVTPVHFTGHVGSLVALADAAKQKGWVIVEDAAHAIGAEYEDASGRWHKVGACAHSAMCCFSFHPVKHVTTGEGGAVTTNDPALYRRLKRFRTHGITRDAAELKTPEGDWYYEQHDLGFNYRITDFQCALGVAQMQRLTEFVRRRREIAELYDGELAGNVDVRPLGTPRGSRGSFHLYVVRVPASERKRIFDGLRAAQIGVNVHYIPVYRHPYYREHGFQQVKLPNAERLYSEFMSIPMFSAMTAADVHRVCRELASLVERAPA